MKTDDLVQEILYWAGTAILVVGGLAVAALIIAWFAGWLA